MVPWHAGNAKTGQCRCSFSLSPLSLRWIHPGQREMWVLQNATARQSGTKQDTLPNGQEPPKTSEGEDRAWLLFFWAKHSKMKGSIQSSGWGALLTNYVTELNNKWQIISSRIWGPSHRSSVYRRLWFSAWKHSAVLASEFSSFSSWGRRQWEYNQKESQHKIWFTLLWLANFCLCWQKSDISKSPTYTTTANEAWVLLFCCSLPIF